ncbi:MAG: hypothetical protein QM820_20575 [Minicystis sp.]
MMKFVDLLANLFAMATRRGAALASSSNLASGKLDLGPIRHYLASPTFAKALAEATQFSNGWKIRIEYVLDRAHRTTKERVLVAVVGRGKDQSRYLQSKFEIDGQNGGWSIWRRGPIEKTEITQQEFEQFEE